MNEDNLNAAPQPHSQNPEELFTPLSDSGQAQNSSHQPALSGPGVPPQDQRMIDPVAPTNEPNFNYSNGSTAWDEWNAPYRNAPSSPPAPPAQQITSQLVENEYASSHEQAHGFNAAPTAPVSPQLSQGAIPNVAPVYNQSTTSAKPDHSKGSQVGKTVGVLLSAALIGALAGFGGSMAALSLNDTNGPSNVSTNDSSSSLVINNPETVNGTTAVAAKVLPSVVTIGVTSGNASGSGSGVIISEDGYVITNTHVVTLGGSSANPDIQVATSDGEVYSATIVGLDPIYDLAVIKLTGATGMTPIEFGDSSVLNVGDTTMAVGAPLGLANTVTTGIVSALDRSISIASAAVPESTTESQIPNDDELGGGLPDFFFDFGDELGQQQGAPISSSISIAVVQTDAAINPGNSGGALVDSQGRLIGINVAIATAGGTGSSESGAGSIGVGFAIPSNVVKWVADELIASGEAVHGLLGATVTDAAAGDSDFLGAQIVELTPGGAAAGAGLKAGDVVVGVNENSVTGATDLTAQVRALPGGTEATISFIRQGDQVQTVDVVLGDLIQ